ncbi:MAG: ABC transporter ATP-binding protein [Gammaproteobacteria bacterium]
MSLLTLSQLSIHLPDPAGPVALVDGLDLTLERGQVQGLVGESGCGKSMTALAIMGLLPRLTSASGQIVLSGRDLLQLPERELCRVRGKAIGMIFQEPLTALNPVKTIGAQIAESIRLHLPLNRTDAERRTRRLLDRVGLPAPRFSPHLYPHQLSGGQRQRVVIAIALACGPQLLIADEPTTALDVVVQAQILDLLLDIVTEQGMGLLLITHDLGVVAECADRVAVMYAGRIVEAARPHRCLPAVPTRIPKRLLRAMPQFDLDAAGKTRLATIPGLVPAPNERPAGCVFSNRCDYRQSRCQQQTPPLDSIASQHQAACYYPLG